MGFIYMSGHRDAVPVQPNERRFYISQSALSALPRTPGFQFVGVTASGRDIRCTVDADGGLHADNHQIVQLVGWRSIS